MAERISDAEHAVMEVLWEEAPLTAQDVAERVDPARGKRVLNRHDTPKWTLPVLGGAVFTALVALWITSSVWFFTTTGITF